MNGVKPDEASALATFSRLCVDKGLLKRPTGLKEEDILDGISDEGTLLRFLQANSMDPTKALDQFQQATDFRAKNDAARLYDTIRVDDFEDTGFQYPNWTGRCDREGRPILMFDVATLDKQTMTHWRETRDQPGDSPSMAQRALAHFDQFTRFVLPLCSAVHGRPVTSCVYLVNVSSIGMKQAWEVREFAQDISGLLATCYPETIHRVYALNCPSILATLWKMLKGFVDPVTAKKIQFLQPSDSYSVLSQEIDHDNLPSCIGGGMQTKTGMLPDLDEASQRALDWTSSQGEMKIPSGPLKWIQSEGRRRAVATGTVNGEARLVEVARLRS